MNAHFQHAIALAGGPAALATRLTELRPEGSPVLPQHVVNWRRRRVPGEWCLPVEAVVDGAVTRYQLRPDVFGPAPVVRTFAHAAADAPAAPVATDEAA